MIQLEKAVFLSSTVALTQRLWREDSHSAHGSTFWGSLGGQAFGDDSPSTASNCERLTRSRCAV